MRVFEFTHYPFLYFGTPFLPLHLSCSFFRYLHVHVESLENTWISQSFGVHDGTLMTIFQQYAREILIGILEHIENWQNFDAKM